MAKALPPGYYENYILSHFQYNNGELIRDDRKNGNGSLDKDGYLIIKVKGKQFKAHRIVWLLHYGSFPKSEIDHINRIRTDNRIENLRESNRREQIANRDIKPNKDTGCIGVYFDRTKGLKKHFATKFNGKTYRFMTVEEAYKFRKENYNHGRSKEKRI